MNREHRRRDLLLTAILLCFALLSLALRAFLFRGSGRIVSISQNGKTIAEYPLDQDRLEAIPAPHGGSNTLHIENGEVWITDASCPDKLCEQQGAISEDGEVLVCMPNLLIVRISE